MQADVCPQELFKPQDFWKKCAWEYGPQKQSAVALASISLIPEHRWQYTQLSYV